MRAVAPKLVGVPLARDTDHKPELPVGSGLHSRKGILDNNRPCRLNPEQVCRHQVSIRLGFACQVPRMDRVAIDLYVEEVLQFRGLQNGGAVLARGDDRDFEPLMPKLIKEFNAALVRLHPFIFDDLVDQVVLAVPKAVHRFSLWRIIRASLGEPDAARCQKVANAVVAGLAIHIEPIVRSDVEGTKCFACLRRTPLKILVKHLSPAGGVDAGGVGDHAVEVEQDSIVSVSCDRTLALGLPPRLLSICFTHSIVLPVSTWSAGRRPLTSERPVPDLHSGYVAVIAEDTQGACIEQEVLPGARGQPNPASAEHAQHMPVREDRHVAVSGARPGNDPIRAGCDLLRAFAARTAITENQPARPGRLDLRS